MVKAKIGHQDQQSAVRSVVADRLPGCMRRVVAGHFASCGHGSRCWHPHWWLCRDGQGPRLPVHLFRRGEDLIGKDAGKVSDLKWFAVPFFPSILDSDLQHVVATILMTGPGHHRKPRSKIPSAPIVHGFQWGRTRDPEPIMGSVLLVRAVHAPEKPRQIDPRMPPVDVKNCETLRIDRAQNVGMGDHADVLAVFE